MVLCWPCNTWFARNNLLIKSEVPLLPAASLKSITSRSCPAEKRAINLRWTASTRDTATGGPLASNATSRTPRVFGEPLGNCAPQPERISILQRPSSTEPAALSGSLSWRYRTRNSPRELGQMGRETDLGFLVLPDDPDPHGTWTD